MSERLEKAREAVIGAAEIWLVSITEEERKDSRLAFAIAQFHIIEAEEADPVWVFMRMAREWINDPMLFRVTVQEIAALEAAERKLNMERKP